VASSVTLLVVEPMLRVSTDPVNCIRSETDLKGPREAWPAGVPPTDGLPLNGSLLKISYADSMTVTLIMHNEFT